jgi:beta-lactamase regulating signal transducer with metallopeptidase domain
VNELSIAAGRWLLHTALGGGCLLLIVCLLLRRTRQPAKQQRLGEWGMAAALLLAVLCLPGRPWVVVSWTGPAAGPRPIQGEDETTKQTMARVDLDNEKSLRAVLDMVATLPEAGSQTPLAGVEVASPTPETEKGIDWFKIGNFTAIGLFALAAGYFALRIVLGQAALLRLRLRSQPAPNEIQDVFESMTGDAKKARLLVSQRLALPLSCGLLRPTVILPSSLCQQPAFAKLRWIFAHELTHLRRLDAWSGLLFALGQVVFFYLPWFWTLRKQVRLCQEFVADAVATQQEGQAVQYAEFLVSLVDAPATPAAATGVGGQPSDLFRRVTMLLERPVAVETRCTRSWTFFVAISLAAVAVLAAGVGYRAEAGPEDTIVIVINPGSGAGTPGQKTTVPTIRADQGGPTATRVLQLMPETANPANLLERVLSLRQEQTSPVLERVLNIGPRSSRQPDVNQIQLPNGEKATVISPGVIITIREVFKDDPTKPRTTIIAADTVVVFTKGDLSDLIQGIGQAPRAAQMPHSDSNQLELYLRGNVEISNKVAREGQRLQGKEAYYDVNRAVAFLIGTRLAINQPVMPDPLAHHDQLTLKHVEALNDVDARIEKAKADLRDWTERANWSLRMHNKGLMSKVQAETDANRVDAAGISLQKTELEKRILLQRIQTENLNEIQKTGEKGGQLNAEKVQSPAPKSLDPISGKIQTPLQEQLDHDRVKVQIPRPGQSDDVYEALIRLRNASNEKKALLKEQAPPAPRFGVTVEPVNEALAEHLGLPKNVGMMVVDVIPETPAAKIGVKAKDILVKIDGAMIPSNDDDFVKLVAGLKSRTPFDLIVIRKGQETNLGKLELAAAAVSQADQQQIIEALAKRVEGRTENLLLVRASLATLLAKSAVAKSPGATLVVKQSDNGLALTVTGTLDNGKFTVSEIEIQDGAISTKYQKIDQVPEANRPAVEKLVERLSAQPLHWDKKEES